MKRYGYVERDGYPVAAWIWGHRLRQGQDWIEYLLEFLNVLAGFGYELGQGIKEGVRAPSAKEDYIRFTRLGLRRFVFYDEREKTRHPFDDHARRLLDDDLKTKVAPSNSDDSQEPLNLARLLLRAFSAVEAHRSWYAKSFFPAHHNLLLWEALRKGATKYRSRSVPPGMSAQQLDAEIAFDARNFFARGGEMYYLILSAGTENKPDLRREIAQRLQTLLLDHNVALGRLAELIDRIWQERGGNKEDLADGESIYQKTGRLGWLPDPDCPFYATIAEDAANLLRSNLDALETLDLLAHLIGFHLTLYIYHRAHPNSTAQAHADGTCLESCRPALLIDALEGSDGGVVRNVSATLFRQQEASILETGKSYVGTRVTTWLQELKGSDDFAHHISSEANVRFNLSGLRKATRQTYERGLDDLLEKLSQGQLDRDAFAERYGDLLTELLMGDFRKNFLGVHRKLAKAVGFVAPRQGPGARFVIGDNLLKALTLANLPPATEMPYHDFLALFYKRYGLVVGSEEARSSGLSDRQRINLEYYDRLRLALLEKMKHAGLAVEYSDATAMAANPSQ